MLALLRIQGTRVFIRDRVDADFCHEAVFAFDEEAMRLNPVVGEYENPKLYTICMNSGEAIGSISIYNYTSADVEVGIQMFKEENRGQGYGTEALSMFVDWMFTVSNVQFVHLKAVCENTRAIKCYEKIGFTTHSDGMLDGYHMVYMRKYRKEKDIESG